MDLAWELIKSNGFCLAEPNGEDSSGRQTIKLVAPLDVVLRAFSIAEDFVRLSEEKEYLILKEGPK